MSYIVIVIREILSTELCIQWLEHLSRKCQKSLVSLKIQIFIQSKSCFHLINQEFCISNLLMTKTLGSIIAKKLLVTQISSTFTRLKKILGKVSLDWLSLRRTRKLAKRQLLKPSTKKIWRQSKSINKDVRLKF